MLGLPTETDEDVLGIAEIAKRIRYIYIKTTGRKDITINVSTSMFIPKPCSPFQWVEQISMDEMYRKQNLLKQELFKIKGVHYAYHAADLSVLEGIFARGDRSLSYAIESAYNNGCIFDGWSETFNMDGWDKALKENNVDIKKYTGLHEIDARLPWDFIDFGTTKEYFKEEYFKALRAETTKPCKYECNACGASRFGKCRLYKKKASND